MIGDLYKLMVDLKARDDRAMQLAQKSFGDDESSNENYYNGESFAYRQTARKLEVILCSKVCQIAYQKTAGKFYCSRSPKHDGPCAATEIK